MPSYFDKQRQPLLAKISGGWRGQSGSRQERGYGAAWNALRVQILERDKRLCQPCLALDRPTPARTVDHITPKAQGGTDEPENLRAICDACHAAKTAEEGLQARATLKAEGKRHIGVDGWAVEPKQWGFSIPHGMRPSAIPVHLVVGPPGSGKTTYVHQHARKTDKVIDLDEIKQRVGGRSYDVTEGVIKRSLAYRDMMIRSLADNRGGAAWLIVTAPTKAERAAWLEALGSMARLVVIDTDTALCIERIKADPDRAEARHEMIALAQRWER